MTGAGEDGERETRYSVEGLVDWIDWKIRIGWRIQTSREIVPSVIIGYIHIYIRMEKEECDARFGREKRDARG